MENSQRETAIKLITVIATMAIVKAKEKKNAKRKLWSRKWLLRRKQLGCYENLMRELALEDSEGYRRWIRMDTNSFEFLLNGITDKIAKRNTRLREAIPPGERLAVTLRFLATGETQSSLSFQFRIAQNTISGIIVEVCKAISTFLQPLYLSTPNKMEEWKEVGKKFYELWNFPMCIGAMDGKHVKISPPPRSVSLYYNYKGDFSIVLLAVVDADLKFLYVDIGTNGLVSDGGVWAKSMLKKAIDENTLNIPEADHLPMSTVKVPYVIVADDAFPLCPNILKPYPGQNLNLQKRIFNYRLSRARRVSENAFGILAARFQLYKSKILSCPQNAKHFIMATCCLHNFLRCSSSAVYTPKNSIDEEDVVQKCLNLGDWHNTQNALASLPRVCHRGTQQAKYVQNIFCNYFNTIGSVPWQNDMCLLH